MSYDHLDPKTRTLQAIILVVLGYFGYAVSDLTAKILQDNYIVYQVLFINAALCLLITGVWGLYRYGIKGFFPPNLKMHLLRGLIISSCAFCMVNALKYLPLADFYGIVFTIPFFTMIFAILFLNEKIGWRRWTASIVAFLGIIIISGPQFNALGTGVIFALTGAVLGASSVIVLRKIGKTFPPPLFGFWPFFFMFIGCAAALLLTDSAKPILTADIPYILITPPFTILGITCISMGYARAPDTSIVSPFHYTQIIWGVAFGWVFFDTLPTQTTFLGVAIIIGAGLYTLWREYVHKHRIKKAY